VKVNKHLALQLAAVTIIGMPLIGYIIMCFFPDEDYITHFIGLKPIWQQLVVGSLVGLGAAGGALLIIRLPFLREASLQYAGLLSSLKLTQSEKVYVSVCAGIGEEFLFRGVVQPLLGIWVTAVVFVGLHGYLNLRDWRIFVYGLYMTAVVVLFGFLTIEYGLMTAIVAHTLVDILLLAGVKSDDTKEEDWSELNEQYEEEKEQ